MADERRDALRTRPVEYPERDGKPMAESDEHADVLRECVETLRDHLAGEAVYVSGNNFVYYTEGEPRDVVSPDCYVVKGVPMGQRRTFRVWEEGGHRPCFVLEITSRSTRKQDLGEKMSTYRDDLQVPEYFLFDLSRDWIDGGLLGYRLEGAEYHAIDPGPDGRLTSEQLGLELASEGRRLRFYPRGAPDRLLSPRELAEQEKARAEREKARAEQAKARAEQEKARAEQEKARAERAEAELAQLKVELERLRGGGDG